MTAERSWIDPFYPVLPDADWIERLVPLGVRLVQLRAKDMAEDELRHQICRSLAICKRFGCTLVVNDHWRLAIEERATFVHLGQEDLMEADVGAIRAAGLHLGISTHDEAELMKALAVDPDYIALGPIWPTVLKAMKWAPQTPARLSAWRARIGEIPLVAIGGLTVERLPEVWRNRADIASVVTDITRSDDPDGRTREWIAATRSHLVGTA